MGDERDREAQTIADWGFKGEIHGCYHVPVELKFIGYIPLKPPLMLGPGDTLEYWLVIANGESWYEGRIRPARSGLN